MMIECFLILILLFIWWNFFVCIKWFLKIVFVIMFVLFVWSRSVIICDCILVGKFGWGIVLMLIGLSFFGLMICRFLFLFLIVIFIFFILVIKEVRCLGIVFFINMFFLVIVVVIINVFVLMWLGIIWCFILWSFLMFLILMVLVLVLWIFLFMLLI